MNEGVDNHKFIKYYLKYRKSNFKVVRRMAYILLKVLGAEIPLDVKIGSNFKADHLYGIVIHPETEIGNNVYIHQHVTIGRGDDYRQRSESKFDGFVIEEDVYIGAGAKIICSSGKLVIGRGTVIGANAVLLNSTGENEVWVGVPAKKVDK